MVALFSDRHLADAKGATDVRGSLLGGVCLSRLSDSPLSTVRIAGLRRSAGSAETTFDLSRGAVKERPEPCFAWPEKVKIAAVFRRHQSDAYRNVKPGESGLRYRAKTGWLVVGAFRNRCSADSGAWHSARSRRRSA